MRQNTRLAILAAELERQSPPETSHQAPVSRQLEPEPEEETSDGDRQPLHSATAISLRGGAPSKRETVKREGGPKGEAGIDTPDPRTPILRTPRMARSGYESVQATPSTVPRSAPEGKRECAVCGLQKSPRWRTGPDGPKTLCNRCGVYWATMRHKWDNLVARFKGDSHTKTRGTPATNGGEEEEEGGTGVSVPRGRKPGKGKVTDPTPTPKNTRKRTIRTIPNPTPLAQGNGGPPFLDSATANGLNGGIATRSAEHAPAAARQLELATEEKSKPPKKRWIEELTDTSPKRRSGQAVRWRALSDEGDVAAAEPSNGGPAKRRRTEIEALRSSMASEAGEEGLPLPDVRKEGRMQRGLARVLEAQREANGGPEVAEASPREKEAAPAKRRRTELDGLLDLVKKEEVPRTGDGRLQRGLARVLEAQRLANGDGEEMDVALGTLESGELMTRRRLGRRANGSLGEDESGGLGEDHNPALVRNRKSKPPNGLGKGLGGRRELRPRSGNRSRVGNTESESEGEQGKLAKKGKGEWEEGGLANGLKDEWRKVPEKRGRGEVLSDALGGVPNEENGIFEHGLKDRTALCMVCEARPREALFSPCGHFNFCYSCAMQHHKGKGDCPKCGQRVTGVQKVVL